MSAYRLIEDTAYKYVRFNLLRRNLFKNIQFNSFTFSFILSTLTYIQRCINFYSSVHNCYKQIRDHLLPKLNDMPFYAIKNRTPWYFYMSLRSSLWRNDLIMLLRIKSDFRRCRHTFVLAVRLGFFWLLVLLVPLSASDNRKPWSTINTYDFPLGGTNWKHCRCERRTTDCTSDFSLESESGSRKGKKKKKDRHDYRNDSTN